MKKVYVIVTAIFILLFSSQVHALRKTAECKGMVEAAKKGDHDKVKELIGNACDMNLTTMDNMTPLMWASYNGHFEVVKVLLEENATVNLKDTGEGGGFTALMMATITGRFAIVKELLSHGANPNVTRENGKTALMGSVENGYMAITKLLLDSGADVNAQDDDGGTALLLAKKSEQKKIAKFLKKRGALELDDLR